MSAYTQCPKCGTVFVVTPAQLAQRHGRVRCGECQAVFRADQNLFDTLPAPVAPPAKAADERAPVGPVGAKPSARRARRWPWALGSLIAVLILTLQAAYFLRSQLAVRYPVLAPWLKAACARVGCAVPPPADLGRIALTHALVGPTSGGANALRVTAVLVNRAPFPQTYPDLELTLTDTEGDVIARRAYAPAAYLPKAHPRRMPPEQPVHAAFTVQSPGPTAVGYEVRIVSAHR